MMQTNYDKVILFDGVCNLCIGIVQFTIKRDPQAIFSFASLQSDVGKKFLNEYGLPADSLDTFVYIKNNKCYLKSTAGLKVLKELGWPLNLLYPLIIVPKALRDKIYDWIARSRYNRFGKQDICMVPDPEFEGRFLR